MTEQTNPQAMTLQEATKQVAKKYDLNSNLVTGHTAKYWTEAAELYADSQCAPLREEIERLKSGSSNAHALKLHDYCKELEAQLEGDKWISVKDRLPEVEGRYLTMRHSGSIIVEHWFKKDSKFLWGDCYGVKFWMPIPEPPKQ